MTRTTRFGFALAIGGGLLAISPALADAYNVPKLLCLAAGGALIWAGLCGRGAARTALDRPLAALWAVMLLSSFRSVDPAVSVLGMYPQAFYGLLPLALCTALYYGAAAAAEGEAASGEARRWMLAASIPLCAFGICQRVFGDFILHFALPSGNRITSTIGNPIMLGACLVLLFPLALHAALKEKSRLGAAALALIAAALVLTWARGAWVSAAAGAAAYLALSGRLRLRPRHALLLVAAAPLLLALQRGLARGVSDSLRIETAKTALIAFEKRPLLGFGPDTFMIPFRRDKTEEFVRLARTTYTDQFSAHDDLLQVAVTLGLLGLAAYAWLLWDLAARLLRRPPLPEADGATAAIAAALLGLFIQAKVNPVPPPAMALAAILAGLACREASAPRPSSRAAAPLAALLCAACALLLGRFVEANALFRTGYNLVNTTSLPDPAFMTGVNDLRRATELNAWVLDYASNRCDVIFDVSAVAPPEQGKQLIVKSLELTAEAVRLHPGNPIAHDLRARALALSARFGSPYLADAFAEIKTASDMDPTFTAMLLRRMALARAVGDRADFEATRTRYLSAAKLAGETIDPKLLVD
jgi:O-antigen ligase